MNYLYLFSLTMLININCLSMHLDFSNAAKDIGQDHGKYEARRLTAQNVNNTDLLNPLFEQLDIAVKFKKDHPESTSQFKGFIVGFGATILAHNATCLKTKKPVVTLDHAIFEGLVTKRQDDDVATKESREELIKLLRDTLTSMDLLTLDK
ncbi:MAG: hypothetical protein AB7F19_01965 [Candidatus Babeliales bacterium]